MELLFNKQTSCPECGCTVVVAESIEADSLFYSSGGPRKIREHCNGGRWEVRTFLCGYSCEYVPNFSRNETKRACHETAAFKEREQKSKAIRTQIQDLEEQLRAL